jgi:general secretion pathway protein A
MYETHFGLTVKPFAVTPDPRFLYQGRSHREALAALVYGVRERRGFIRLVGEVGTGKTTLLRALLEGLDVSIRTALITHTTIDREELLRLILNDLEMPITGLTRVEMLQALHDLVLTEHQFHRSPPLLIVDEAQNLADEVLEEIRLLTNLEIGESKLLQVILSGQPELERKLEKPALRQLGQRVAVRARLEPLSQHETAAYVRHRLHVAGARDVNLFDDAALSTIWSRTAGIPRLINILCEQALVYAFGANRRRVDQALLEEAVRDLGLDQARAGLPAPSGRRAPERHKTRWQSIFGLISVLVAGIRW